MIPRSGSALTGDGAGRLGLGRSVVKIKDSAADAFTGFGTTTFRMPANGSGTSHKKRDIPSSTRRQRQSNSADPPPSYNPNYNNNDSSNSHDDQSYNHPQHHSRGKKRRTEERQSRKEEEEGEEEEEEAMSSNPPSSRAGRSKDQPFCLSALLPGSQISDPSRRILINTAPTKEMVKFNIGGTIFETYRSTLYKLPGSPLANEALLEKHFQEDRNQYFFDRDPEVFGAILNYLRTGELHLPTKFCGPAVKTEMEYWGVEEDEIEECCWTTYSAWTTTLEALQKLEKDRKVHMAGFTDDANTKSTGNKLRQIKLQGWTMINNPRSSIAAQVYSYASLLFVVLSIFSFVAQTHEYFRVPITDSYRLVDPQPNSTNGSPIPSPLNITRDNSTSSGIGVLLNTTTQDTRNSSGMGLSPNTATPANNVTADSSFPEDEVHPVLTCVDAVCLIFFLIEFGTRLALSPRRLKILLMPMTIFEMLALLPDLIEFSLLLFHPSPRSVSGVDVITFLRLLRVFRIFRLMRHFPGLWILFYTLKASIKELLLLLLFLCVGMLFFASLIYYADDRKVFPSIPMACWWSIITMTTVGYGDVSPTTQWGYVVGSMTAVCGVLVIGFTVPVLVNNFILYYQHTQSAINRESGRNTRASRKRSMHPDHDESFTKSSNGSGAGGLGNVMKDFSAIFTMDTKSNCSTSSTKDPALKMTTLHPSHEGESPVPTDPLLNSPAVTS